MDSDREPAPTERSPDTPSGATTQPVTPPQSRFLFVNVAAQRAKQLRRGALPRLPELRPDPATGTAPQPNSDHKPESVAIEEVARGLVPYALPDEPGSRREVGSS